MKTLSQRIIDFAHNGEVTTATDKDRQLTDAAPDMLTALQEIHDMLRGHPEFKSGNSKVHFLTHKASAAITKATA